jgi:hypothetical protein
MPAQEPAAREIQLGYPPSTHHASSITSINSASISTTSTGLGSTSLGGTGISATSTGLGSTSINSAGLGSFNVSIVRVV